MFSKGVWIGVLAVCAGVMLVDRYNFLIGAAICGILSYLLTSSAIRSFLIGIYIKFRNTPIKHLRRRRRKIVTVSSSVLDFVIENFVINVIVKFRLKTKPKPQFAHLENVAYDRLDNSPTEVHVAHDAKQYCGHTPCRAEEIKTFMYHILSNFVLSWYHKISPNPEFAVDVEYVLEETLSRTCEKLSRLNVNHFMHQLLILYHNHILVNAQLIRKWCGEGGRHSAEHEIFLSNLHVNLETDTLNGHAAVKDKKSENWYLVNVCEILMDLLGMEEVLHCPAVQMAIRDLLAQNMFLPLVNLLSDPVWIYWAICHLFGDGAILNQLLAGAKPDVAIDSDFKRSTKNQRSPKRPQPLGRECLSKRSLSYCSLSEITKELENDTLPVLTVTKVKSDAKLNPSCTSDPLLASAEDVSLDGPAVVSVPTRKSKAAKSKSLVETRLTIPTGSKQRCSSFSGSPCRVRHSHSLDSALSRSMENVFRSKNHFGDSPKHSSLPRAMSAVEVEQALEVVERFYTEPNKKLFSNISVVSAEERYDTKRHSYTLYCIEYEISAKVANEEGEFYTRRTLPAWRRFKEFMALQERLEGHPELKHYLKGIKGPTKWLAAPFGKLDKRNVEARRQFLQEYLRKLCDRPELANSHELQQFLAYRGDASIAFVKKAPELPVPRLDKVVLRGLMGALDLIKTALPNMPQETVSLSLDTNISNGEKSPSMLSLLQGFRKSRYNSKGPEIDFVYKQEGVTLEQTIYNYLERLLTSSPEDSAPGSPVSATAISTPNESSRMSKWKRAVGSLHSSMPHGYRSEGDGCDSEELGQKKLELDESKIDKLQEAIEEEIPLADVISDLVLQVLPSTHFLSDDAFVLFMKLIFGQVCQRWIHELFLMDEEKWIEYLHHLHDALWPEDLTDSSSKSVEMLEIHRLAAFRTIRSLFPGFLDKVYNSQDIDDCLNLWLDCLKNSQQNRSLVYQLIDVLVDMLCAQELKRTLSS